MGQITKGMLGIFFLFLVTVVGLGINMAQVETSAAQRYYSDTVAEIKNSNFNTKVMDACKEQAANNGYSLAIRPINDSENNVNMAEVTLQYPYRIGIFALDQTKQIYGYAE
jgi:hypothetical protein